MNVFYKIAKVQSWGHDSDLENKSKSKYMYIPVHITEYKKKQTFFWSIACLNPMKSAWDITVITDQPHTTVV